MAPRPAALRLAGHGRLLAEVPAPLRTTPRPDLDPIRGAKLKRAHAPPEPKRTGAGPEGAELLPPLQPERASGIRPKTPGSSAGGTGRLNR